MKDANDLIQRLRIASHSLDWRGESRDAKTCSDAIAIIQKQQDQIESIKLYNEVQNLKKTNEGLSNSVEFWMQNYLNLKKAMLKVLND